MNREVVYERNLTGSYMKLPADEEYGFDEKMLLRKKLPGLLSVEKCYVDGEGQYWYNISGKQSLDTYCRIREIGIEFVEQMIVSICSEIEILERNLIDADCLLLGAEQIFVSNKNQEIIFAAYPGEKEPVSDKFRQLMEYLLTKINHRDQAAVQMAYGLYEKTLDEGYSIMDVRDSIIEARKKAAEDSMEEDQTVGRYTEWEERDNRADDEESLVKRKREKSESKPEREPDTKMDESPAKRNDNIERIKELYQKMKDIWEEWRNSLLEKLPKKKAPSVEIVYPDEEDDLPEHVPESHPTICLNEYCTYPEGILVYEGHENFADIRLNASDSMMVGKGDGVDISIEKETISNYHAQIRCCEQEYYIEDLNSTNGTYVNEELLFYKEKRKLKSNDVIRFADVKYRFV